MRRPRPHERSIARGRHGDAQVVAGREHDPGDCARRESASSPAPITSPGIECSSFSPRTSLAAMLAVMFFASLPVLLLVPALATVAILALLHAMQPLVAARRLERGRVRRASRPLPGLAAVPGPRSRSHARAGAATTRLRAVVRARANRCVSTSTPAADTRRSPSSIRACFGRSRSAIRAAFRWQGRSRSKPARTASLDVRNAGSIGLAQGRAPGRWPRP